MKKLFPLFILLILVSFLPFVKAETESLYVDSKTTDMQNWDQRNAPSPYLADESTGYIRETKSSAATEGYFGFADPSGTGTINNVYLYVECYGDDTNDQIWIFVDCSDGSGWVNEGTIYVNQLSYDWEILFLTTRLDSWPDIQNTQIYLYYQGVGGGDDIYVRRAFLYVEYIPAGTEYTRVLSQSLSLTGDSYRTCNLERTFTQGLTLASDNLRTWDTKRFLTQSTTLATTASRNWNPLRTLTQGISVSFNTYTEHFAYFLRSLTLSLNLATESFRTWNLSRLLDQGLTLTSDSLKSMTMVRTLTQGLSFLSSAIGQNTGGAGQILRTITMSLSLTTESLRSWTLSRTLSQGMTLINNAIGQKYLGELIKRVATLMINLDTHLAVTTNIINEMNIEMIGLIGLTLLVQVAFMILVYNGKKPLYRAILGMVATLCWFAMGHISLSMNPIEGFAIAYVYDAIAILNTLFAVKAALDFMQLSQDSDDFWEIT